MTRKKLAETWVSLTALLFSFFVSANFFTQAIAEYGVSNPHTIFYSDETTLAEVVYGDNGIMIHCRLHEFESAEDGEAVIRGSGLKVIYPDFQTMLRLINACTRLEKPPTNSTQGSPTNTSSDLVTDFWSSWSIWNGIMPGTKWCGMGDIAESFEELGSQIEVDACCRAHDYCPVKLKSFRSGYGLINLSFYTKSHCDCDREFFTCLKDSKNKAADIVGNFYFNVMKVQCLKEYRPFICIENRTGTEQCTKWGPDPDSKKMQVTISQMKY